MFAVSLKYTNSQYCVAREDMGKDVRDFLKNKEERKVCFMNYFKKLFARSSFLQVAATSFPGPIGAQVAIHEIAIPDSNIFGLCGGQNSPRDCHLGCRLAAFQNVVKCS